MDDRLLPSDLFDDFEKLTFPFSPLEFFLQHTGGKS